jgi:hypothetical protein
MAGVVRIFIRTTLYQECALMPRGVMPGKAYRSVGLLGDPPPGVRLDHRQSRPRAAAANNTQPRTTRLMPMLPRPIAIRELGELSDEE